MNHLRETPPKFQSKKDFEYLDEVGNKTILISFYIVVGGFFLLICLIVISSLFLLGDPLDKFFKSKYSVGVLFLIFYAIYEIYSRSPRFQRDVKELTSAFSLKNKYEKAEKRILKGICERKLNKVRDGINYLEHLKVYFSEMPEYNELLEKGKNWLKENDGK